MGAEGGGAGVVVVGGFFDDGAGGQEGLEIEAQVELGGGLAAAVFRPRHAVGKEGNGGGVDGADGGLETAGHTFVTQSEASG